MKILVTGATGFIGRYILKFLQEKAEYEIIATGRRHDKLQESGIRFIGYDINEPRNDVYSFLGEPEAVIHLAWEGLPNYQSDFHYEHNLPNNFRFLKNMIEGGVENISVCGTCAEYGMHADCLSENMTPSPVNSYARAKDELRNRLETLTAPLPLSFKWIRLFYMFGRGQNPQSIFSQLTNCIKNGDKVFNMSGGEQVRDYLPVETMAEYIAKISVQTRVNGIINCCSGKPAPLKNLVKQWVKDMHADIELNLGYYPYAKDEPMAFWGDTARLESALKAYDSI